MIPLLLLIIVISYRYIKRKNSEAEIKEKEIYFAELEERRQKLYEDMYENQHREEIETLKHLEQGKIVGVTQIRSNQIPSNVIDDEKMLEKIDHGDETDDEFFELPLPPVPAFFPKNVKLSITDNEGISPTTSFIQETPKVSNNISVFNFSQRTPAENLCDNASSKLPVLSPQSLSNPKSSGNSEHPIDYTSKLPLESDF